jgi:AcrR family transcriptional regulator
MVKQDVKSRADEARDVEVRQRILAAAFSAFMEQGFAGTSTLEIATRAKASKRELYAHFGNKQQILIACIRERAKRFELPADLPVARDRKTLERLLATFGARLVTEITHPMVIAVFRIAIAEAVQAPEVAAELDSVGREATRAALRKIMGNALRAGLLTGRAAELAEQFAGLLWRDLLVSLILGVVSRPKPRQIDARSRKAAEDFLQIHRLGA